MSLPLEQEQQLLERAREGDDQAYEALILAFTDPLYRVVRRLASDSQEAEVVVQEAFWRAWRSLGHYDSSRPFFPYLVTVALNLQRDTWRLQRRIEERDLEDVVGEVTDPLPEPSARLESDENLGRLSEAVQHLSRPYRAVITLRYEADMNYEEIAEALKLPVNTVRTHLHRAKQMLRKMMEDYNG